MKTALETDEDTVKGEALYIPIEGEDFAQRALALVREAVKEDADVETCLLLDGRRAVWNAETTVQARIFIWGLCAYSAQLSQKRALIISPDFVSNQYARFLAMLDDVWNNASMSTFSSPEGAVAWLASGNDRESPTHARMA